MELRNNWNTNMNNLLFICSRNQWRSPTGETVYRQKGYSVRSAGTSPNAKRTVNATDIKWADIVFVMEKKHKNRLVANFASLLEYKPLHVLNIPDEYKYMDAELVQELEEIVGAHLVDNTVDGT